MTHGIIYETAPNLAANLIEFVGGCFEVFGQRIAFFGRRLSRVEATPSPTATLIANTAIQDVSQNTAVLEFLDDGRY
jgi:hypothetical protein